MTIHRLVSDHPEPALMLSIGEAPQPGRNYPQRLEWFRAKPGRDGKWKAMADAFDRQYNVLRGDNGQALSGPKAVPVYFLSDSIPDVLDVRFLAFTTAGLAARGHTNYAAEPEAIGRPDVLTVFPQDSEPYDVAISGPNDPLCMGGEHGIPRAREDSSVKAVELVATLYFGLAEVGSFTAPCAISTKSGKSAGRVLQRLWQMRATGTLTQWLMQLVVKPMTVRFLDPKTRKRTSSQTVGWDLVGPIRSLEDRAALTVPEMREVVAAAHARGLLAGGVAADQAPAQITQGEPAQLPAGDDGDDGEALTGEVVQ